MQCAYHCFVQYSLQAPKNGMFVGAACHGGPVSPKLQVPFPKGACHTIPKLTVEEASQQLCHYTAQVTVSLFVTGQ